MADFNVQGLQTLQRNLQGIDKNFIGLNGNGVTVATTDGKITRFFGRIFALFDRSTRADNQRTIDALLRQIESTPSMGKQYADVFREKSAQLVTDGKPLSGRKIAIILGDTIHQAHSSAITDASRAKLVRDMTTEFFDGTGFDAKVKEFEVALQVPPDQLGLNGRRDELRAMVEERLARATAGKDATPADLQNIAGDVIKRAAVSAHFDATLDAAYAAIVQDYGLDGLTDLAALKAYMKQSGVNHFMDRDRKIPLTAQKFAEYLPYSVASFAQMKRGEAIDARVAPFLMTDDSPDGLLAAFQARADRLVPGVEIKKEVLATLALKTQQRAKSMFVGENPPLPALPDADTLRGLRDSQLDAYFAEVQQWANTLPEEERTSALTVCVTQAARVKPPLYHYSSDIAKATEQFLASALQLRSSEDLQERLAAFNSVVRQFDSELPSKEEKIALALGPDDYQAAFAIAYGIAADQLIRKNGLPALSEMAAVGSPFIALKNELMPTDGEDDNSDSTIMRSALRNILTTILQVVAERLPEEEQSRLLS